MARNLKSEYINKIRAIEAPNGYKFDAENMTIAEKIRESQDVKEMTWRAIQILEKAGQNVEELKAEFLEIYNEEV